MIRWFFLLGLLTIFACASDLEVVELMDEETGLKEIYQRSKKTGLREGFYHRIDSSGILMEEAHYKQDTLHGIRKLFHENGVIEYEESHDMGRYHGPFRNYYEDGTLEMEGEYKHDEMVGVWTRYYPGGQKMEEVQFSNNMENGPFTEWYENGKLKATGSYLEGDNEHGELLEYNEEGVLIARKECVRGICQTRWTLEGGEVAPKPIGL
jgi:antitoxin component YwqK of YwqJK toxin-antitoxin module